MSSIQDKQLMLLGLLSSQDMHGYQLGQLLSHASNPIKVGKANAYKLLANMEREKLIESYTTQEGARPARTNYQITASGQTKLNELLRRNLSGGDIPEFPSGIGLNFLHLLPKADVAELLLQKIERLAAHRASLEYDDDTRAAHPGTDLMIKALDLELRHCRELASLHQERIE